MQCNQSITKPQGTKFFLLKQIPNNVGTWSFDPWESRSVGMHKNFPPRTNFCYV